MLYGVENQSARAVYLLRKRYMQWIAKPESDDRTLFLSMLKERGEKYGVDITQPVFCPEPRAYVPKEKIKPIELLPDLKSSDEAFTCKVKFDGSHFIAIREGDNAGTTIERHPVTTWDNVFDIVYSGCLSEDVPKSELFEVICHRLSEWYDYSGETSLECFVHRKLWNIDAAKHMRRFRFRAKRFTVKWQYFVTFTYDDRKMNEYEFYCKIKRHLNYLHTKYRVLYIGRFERGEENGRLHLHVVMYAPKGFPGEFYDVWRWSEKEHRMRLVTENSFYKKKFGNNEFDVLDSNKSIRDCFDYVFKYMDKDETPVIYSRGIPSHEVLRLTSECFNVGYVIRMKRKITRYVLNEGTVVRNDVGFSAVYPAAPPKDLFELLERAKE